MCEAGRCLCNKVFGARCPLSFTSDKQTKAKNNAENASIDAKSGAKQAGDAIKDGAKSASQRSFKLDVPNASRELTMATMSVAAGSSGVMVAHDSPSSSAPGPSQTPPTYDFNIGAGSPVTNSRTQEHTLFYGAQWDEGDSTGRSPVAPRHYHTWTGDENALKFFCKSASSELESVPADRSATVYLFGHC